MNRTDKSCVLALIVVLSLSSLVVIKSASAEVPKPAAPTFTGRYIDYSYDVPPTYGTDQYTGKTIMTEPGEHIDNRTIIFTIQNPPFTSYKDANGNDVKMFYNFRYKGSYGEDWAYYPFKGNQTTHSYGPYSGGFFIFYNASNKDTTVLSVSLKFLPSYPSGPTIPNGSQVDFQVQTQVGYIAAIPSGLLAGDFYSFIGETSDWSNTQTLTVDDTTAIPSQTTEPTSTPTPSPAPTNLSIQNATTTIPTTSSAQPNTQRGVVSGLGWEQVTVIALAVAVVALIVVVAVQQKRLSAKKQSQ
jgi:hypothetical protein